MIQIFALSLADAANNTGVISPAPAGWGFFAGSFEHHIRARKSGPTGLRMETGRRTVWWPHLANVDHITPASLPAPGEHSGRRLRTLQRSVRIVQLGLILFLVLFSRFLGVSKRQISLAFRWVLDSSPASI